MSRLRRLVLSDQYFSVTCNLRRTRAVLNEGDFEILARVMRARREERGFSDCESDVLHWQKRPIRLTRSPHRPGTGAFTLLMAAVHDRTFSECDVRRL
jgi:hypothetical protein